MPFNPSGRGVAVGVEVAVIAGVCVTTGSASPRIKKYQSNPAAINTRTRIPINAGIWLRGEEAPAAGAITGDFTAGGIIALGCEPATLGGGVGRGIELGASGADLAAGDKLTFGDSLFSSGTGGGIGTAGLGGAVGLGVIVLGILTPSGAWPGLILAKSSFMVRIDDWYSLSGAGAGAGVEGFGGRGRLGEGGTGGFAETGGLGNGGLGGTDADRGGGGTGWDGTLRLNSLTRSSMLESVLAGFGFGLEVSSISKV